VVREWFGPLEVDRVAEFRKTLALDDGWKAKDLGVAAFVQDAARGDVLQAMALANCPT